MAWCLLPQAVERFKKGLKEGEISPAKLNEMTTDERVAFLSSYVGEQAAEVNKRFEKSYLLKRRDDAVLKWARETSGVFGARRQALIEKAQARAKEREGRIFNPKEEDTFLGSLAEQKIGSAITREEAGNVFELSRRADAAKAKYDQETGEWTSDEARIEYGASKVMLENYVAGLKDEARGRPLMDLLRSKASEAADSVRARPVLGSIGLLRDAVSGLSNLSVSMVASLDNSFMGRQGLHALLTHPSAWVPGAVNSFVDFYNTFGGKETLDALRADVLSRENAMNGNYYKAKILDQNEEAFPTSFPERIPYVGRAFKASEAAFKGSALRMRTDLFDLLLSQAADSGVDVSDKYQLESIGRVVNSLTAKGAFDKGTPGILKGILWAPKMLKANWDVLTAHTGQDISSFAVKEAWKNLFKIVATTALVLAIANAFDDDSVEIDPRSSDFGKIKRDDTRIDITGGAGSIVTLAARLLSGSTKSTTTGEVKEYGTGFGESTRFDALINFATNKVTPPVRVIIDILKGQTFDGKDVTVGGELYSAAVPIAAQGIIDLFKDPSLNKGIGVATDFVGLSSNTYAESNAKSGLIPEDTKIKNDDFIDRVMVYAEAFGTDPETAFNRIFTGQSIRRVDNGAIIVERLPVGDSQDIKKKAGADNPSVKLDHTIPLQLGGSNGKDNLKLVTTSEHAKYTPVENYLGKLLREDKISKKDAQEAIKAFKDGRTSFDAIKEKYK